MNSSKFKKSLKRKKSKMNSLCFNENNNQGNALMRTSNENLEVCEKKLKGPPWSELPSPAIEKVYSFLNRKDQINMSLVCRNWRNDLSSPSLWRRLKFCFPDLESNTELCPEVIFARRYGSMFHHVDIVFKAMRPPFSLSPISILKQLTLFLQAITCHSQLLSISLKDMVLYLLKVDEATSVEVYQTILSLFKSQKKLQCVEFINCEFKKAAAAEILNVIFVNNSRTLRRLYFWGLVEGHSDKFTDNTIDYDFNFAVLMNLEVLEMDYTQVFENMILSFYECKNRVGMRKRKGCLKEMKLACNGFSFVNYMGIHPPVWNYFKKIFPYLRLELILISSCDPRIFAKYIVPHMPIISLIFTLIPSVLQNREIGKLLRHITSCEINKSLEELRILWPESSADLTTDLLSFTKASPKLKILELSLEHPVTALDTVFNSWLENRPVSLEIVKFTINHVHREEDKANYAHLNDLYAPLLQPMEFSLTLFVR